MVIFYFFDILCSFFRMTYLMPEWDQTKAHPQFFTFKESGRTCVHVDKIEWSTVLAREPIPMQVFACLL